MRGGEGNPSHDERELRLYSLYSSCALYLYLSAVSRGHVWTGFVCDISRFKLFTHHIPTHARLTENPQ